MKKELEIGTKFRHRKDIFEVVYIGKNNDTVVERESDKRLYLYLTDYITTSKHLKILNAS